MMWSILHALLLSSILGHVASTAGTAGGTTVAANRLPRGGSTRTRSGGISQFLEEQGAAADASSVVYPPLSSEEIGDSLRDVPLYYIERKKGGGILVAGGEEANSASAARPAHRDSGWRTRTRQQATTRRQKACYFFLEREASMANLEQVVKGGDGHVDGGLQGQKEQLQISTARLSQLHEKFWNGNSNKQDEMDDEVDFRLVAINQELLRARFLLTVTERDVQRQLSDEEGRRLLAKVNAQPKRFKSSYNDIPLFLLPQLRIKRSRTSRRRKRSSSRWPRLLVPRIPSRRSVESENNMAVPLYFTFEDMKRDLDRASRGGTDTGTCIILNLGELLQQMRKESRGFDYRNIIFVPSGKRVAGTPTLLEIDTEGSTSASTGSSVSEITDSFSSEKGAKYVDGGAGNRGDGADSKEEDRIFWLRPRRRIRQQDLDTLFGPDQ